MSISVLSMKLIVKASGKLITGSSKTMAFAASCVLHLVDGRADRLDRGRKPVERRRYRARDLVDEAEGQHQAQRRQGCRPATVEEQAWRRVCTIDASASRPQSER